MLLRILRAIAFSLCLAAPYAAFARDDVIQVPDDDAEMNAAIAAARASLPTFWQKLAKPEPDEDGFALKVRIVDGGQSEHFWLVDVVRAGDKLSGRINNEPGIVGNVREGDRYNFAEADISDWMFMRNGKIVGNATMRPLLKHMPPEEADVFRKMLETP